MLKTQVETIATSLDSAGPRPADHDAAKGLTPPDVEQFSRNLRPLFTGQGLLSLAKRGLGWLASQCLLLFDFTATLPPFVEQAGRRRFNFWPHMLLFCSTIGFLVSGLILAFSVAQRVWHGCFRTETALSLSTQEGNFLIWAVIGGVGRLAALNLGQAAKDITARRVVGVCLWMVGLAALVALQLPLAKKLSATSPTVLTSAAWFAKWIGFGLLMVIGLYVISILFFRKRAAPAALLVGLATVGVAAFVVVLLRNKPRGATSAEAALWTHYIRLEQKLAPGTEGVASYGDDEFRYEIQFDERSVALTVSYRQQPEMLYRVQIEDKNGRARALEEGGLVRSSQPERRV